MSNRSDIISLRNTNSQRGLGQVDGDAKAETDDECAC
jgi:hypothetical protein